MTIDIVSTGIIRTCKNCRHWDSPAGLLGECTWCPDDAPLWMGDTKHITAQGDDNCMAWTAKRRCRVCGCTDDDCSGCIEHTGKPCWWVGEDLCSACEKAPMVNGGTGEVYLVNPPRERIGDWIQTYSGRCFWPLDPRAHEVRIEDIAHSLSMRCRYGGHCTRFYSVAEHSVLVSHKVPAEHALWGLLHDAAEAYTADVPRPLKKSIPQWAAIERAIMVAVCLRFGLHPIEPDEVKAIDLAITTDERAALMKPSEREWSGLVEPVGAMIVGHSPEMARANFISRFQELTWLSL